PSEEQVQPVSPGPVIEFIYLYDVAKRTITLVNHAPGAPATVQAPFANGAFYDSFHPAISADGNAVAFAFGQPGGDEVGVARYDRNQDATTILASYPDLYPSVLPRRNPVISDDGTRVAYESMDDGTQVSVYDSTTPTTRLVSHAAGSSAPAGGPSTGAV